MDDLRFAVRMLLRNPSFTLAALLTLGLGVALNTCAFSVVNALWFRPIAIRDDASVAVVGVANSKSGILQDASLPEFAAWTARSTAFERSAAFLDRAYNLSGADAAEPERLSGGEISSSGFELLGIFPKLGRPFLAGEYRGEGGVRGAPPVLISEALWRRRFAADPGIGGRQVRLDGLPAVIVGVLPHSFRFIYGGYHIIRPLDGNAIGRAARGERSVQVLARLKPGVTVERAQAELSAISASLSHEYPDTNAGWEARVMLFRPFVFSVALRMYPILLAAALLLLLLVCANVSSLLLARSIARRRELAVRVALGATPFRLVRQMLAEGFLIAFAGAALALCVTACGRGLLVATYPELADLVLDLRVFVYTLLMAGVAGLAFGLAPALTSSRPDVIADLKAGGRGAAGGSAHRLRGVLVVSEMALALVLLVGTGLLIESTRRIRQTSPGFDTGNLLTAQLSLPERAYPSPERRAEFTLRLLDRIASLPGVRSAAVADTLPLCGGGAPQRVDVAGLPSRPEGDFLNVSRKAVTPGYFAALGVAMRAGRFLGNHDRAGSPAVAVLNLAFARAIANSGANPETMVGKRVRVGGGPWRSVVGVMDDVRQVLDQPASPEILVPHGQDPGAHLSLLLRTSVNPKALVSPSRAVLRLLDPDLPVSDIQTMDGIVRDYSPRVMFAGLGIFASVALSLASLGLYGVISFLVAQRTREIGIRIALGADRRHALRLILGHALRLAFAGIAIGLAGAFVLARALARFLYGVSAADPAVFGVAAAALFAVALLAAWLPARRATGIDPAIALRCE